MMCLSGEFSELILLGIHWDSGMCWHIFIITLESFSPISYSNILSSFPLARASYYVSASWYVWWCPHISEALFISLDRFILLASQPVILIGLSSSLPVLLTAQASSWVCLENFSNFSYSYFQFQNFYLVFFFNVMFTSSLILSLERHHLPISLHSIAAILLISLVIVITEILSLCLVNYSPSSAGIVSQLLFNLQTFFYLCICYNFWMKTRFSLTPHDHCCCCICGWYHCCLLV